MILLELVKNEVSVLKWMKILKEISKKDEKEKENLRKGLEGILGCFYCGNYKDEEWSKEYLENEFYRNFCEKYYNDLYKDLDNNLISGEEFDMILIGGFESILYDNEDVVLK